jgi:hypothetical protein
MRNVDLSAYSAKAPRRIRPEVVNLGQLPPIQKPTPRNHKPNKPNREPESENLSSEEPINELRGQSVFFQTKPAEDQAEEVRGGSVRGVGDVRNVRGVRPEKRQRKRHPFDIFSDQLDSLIELKHQAMLRGEETSMSAMVREALDEYIKKHE